MTSLHFNILGSWLNLIRPVMLLKLILDIILLPPAS